MSSTRPGDDAVSATSADEGTAVRQDAAAEPSTRPASSAPGAGDRAALRTSLAERFAAARTVSEDPVVPQPDATAVSSSASTPLRPGSTGEAPRHGAGGAAAAGGGAAGGGSRPTSQYRPTAEQQSAAPAPRSGPRKVRLSVARIDPWSVMKLSFLLSIAVGIGIVIAAAASWYLLDSMHVFADVEELLLTLDSENFLRLMDYVQFDRVISAAAMIAVVDVVLLTALSTLGAFLYNIVAALVGGLHLTLTDD